MHSYFVINDYTILVETIYINIFVYFMLFWPLHCAKNAYGLKWRRSLSAPHCAEKAPHIKLFHPTTFRTPAENLHLSDHIIISCNFISLDAPQQRRMHNVSDQQPGDGDCGSTTRPKKYRERSLCASCGVINVKDRQHRDTQKTCRTLRWSTGRHQRRRRGRRQQR